MTEEVDRCKQALDIAASGEAVAIVSSGDAGVYGMAGLVMELALASPKFSAIDIEVVPGITAVSAAASIVGAPLTHDFAVISLSDLMTPWKVIAKRLKCAAEGDFVIALYNPKSKKRTDHIRKAREIIEQHRASTTPVAIVTNAYRDGQTVALSNLRNFVMEEIGMLSVVIIGNSQSILKDNKIVTPRGYSEKYADNF
jgi:precorrin-3B C17-methyltransferase